MINVAKCGICGCDITEDNPYEAYDEHGNDAFFDYSKNKWICFDCKYSK